MIPSLSGCSEPLPGVANAATAAQTASSAPGSMTRSPTPGEPGSTLPDWMRWLGAGLTALVAVLFVVLLLQVREQSQRLQSLRNRVQTLENANDLERTNALEEQLRSTVQRLQNLEKIDEAVRQLAKEQQDLRLQLRSQSPALEPLPLEPGPTPAPGGRSPQNQPARPGRQPGLQPLPPLLPAQP